MADKIMRDDPNEMTRDCLFILQLLHKDTKRWVADAAQAVWFTREEVESYVASRSYHYGEKNVDWRVYGVCANGALARIIAQHTRPPQ